MQLLIIVEFLVNPALAEFGFVINKTGLTKEEVLEEVKKQTGERSFEQISRIKVYYRGGLTGENYIIVANFQP